MTKKTVVLVVVGLSILVAPFWAGPPKMAALVAVPTFAIAASRYLLFDWDHRGVSR